MRVGGNNTANLSSAEIKCLLPTLTFREREIIKLRFGIGGGHAYTRGEVGKRFKVTRERVRAIEEKALRKMCHPSRLALLPQRRAGENDQARPGAAGPGVAGNTLRPPARGPGQPGAG